tara:strand:+ start:406 stop:537 length:132 start_codon:yes stop_codon:yes gene_type:complete
MYFVKKKRKEKKTEGKKKKKKLVFPKSKKTFLKRMRQIYRSKE